MEDAIEAFGPLPMGDLSLAEARISWEGRIISLNFPESVFLEGSDAVKKYTMKMLSEAVPGDRFIVTNTEDMPVEHRWTGLSVVTNVLGMGPIP